MNLLVFKLKNTKRINGNCKKNKGVHISTSTAAGYWYKTAEFKKAPQRIPENTDLFNMSSAKCSICCINMPNKLNVQNGPGR